MHSVVGIVRRAQQADREPVSEWQHRLYQLQELPLIAGGRLALHYPRNAHSTSTIRQPDEKSQALVVSTPATAPRERSRGRPKAS